MIRGIGCDIVQVSRLSKDKKFLNHFIKKYLTLNEAQELKEKVNSSNEDVLRLAVATWFAAKEAVSKALGTGFQDGITLKDIEIIHNELGAPCVVLYNKALSRAYQISQNQNFQFHITMSNEQEYVNAVAVIESI